MLLFRPVNHGLSRCQLPIVVNCIIISDAVHGIACKGPLGNNDPRNEQNTLLFSIIWIRQFTKLPTSMDCDRHECAQLSLYLNRVR